MTGRFVKSQQTVNISKKQALACFLLIFIYLKSVYFSFLRRAR